VIAVTNPAVATSAWWPTTPREDFIYTRGEVNGLMIGMFAEREFALDYLRRTETNAWRAAQLFMGVNTK
jgi:hypothetical protein